MGEGAHATVPKTKTAANPRRPTASQPAGHLAGFFIDFLVVLAFMLRSVATQSAVV
jgi:hypothetical protein